MPRGKYYILQVDSYTGDDTTRDQHEILDEEGWNMQEIPALYVIVRVDKDGAEIVDDGYRSIEEAQESWPKAAAPNATPIRSHAKHKLTEKQKSGQRPERSHRATS